MKTGSDVDVYCVTCDRLLDPSYRHATNKTREGTTESIEDDSVLSFRMFHVESNIHAYASSEIDEL